MATQPWWNIKPTLSAIADEQDRKIQFVWKQIVDPCDAPFTVWIYLMWEPFKKLVLQWYAVDVLQIYTAYLRPSYRNVRPRGYRHWGGGKKGKRPGTKGDRLNPFTFDPNEFIGDELMGFDELGGIKPYPGELTIWAIEGIVERILFYWMILDLGTDFLYEWTSAVSQTKYCHARDDSVLQAIGDPYPLLGIFGWDPIGLLRLTKIRHIEYFNGYGWSTPIGPSAMAEIVSGTPVPGHVPDPWIEMRLRCLSGPREGETIERHEDGVAGQETVISLQGQMNAHEIWIGELRVNGLWEITSPVLNVHGVYNP